MNIPQFIHSHVNEHLCCFQFSILREKTLLTFLYRSLKIHMDSFTLAIYLRRKFLHHRRYLCSALMDTTKQVLIVFMPMFTPSRNA